MPGSHNLKLQLPARFVDSIGLRRTRTVYPKHSAEVLIPATLRRRSRSPMVGAVAANYCWMSKRNSPFSPVDRSRLLTGGSTPGSQETITTRAGLFLFGAPYRRRYRQTTAGRAARLSLVPERPRFQAGFDLGAQVLKFAWIPLGALRWRHRAPNLS
jgi:hypothetical protein